MSKQKFASNIILFLFVILVGIASFFSDFFQNPIKNNTKPSEQAKLFTSSDLGLINRISLKNKSGEYIFEHNDNNQISPWHMVAPRDISANSLFIEKLFKSLSAINVKKIYPDEKINISNFSIDKPSSTISLIDQNNNTITILLGLMNTIDNSIYLKIAGRPGIYHVEALGLSLENATILDLIESQIISINFETISSFKIFSGTKKSNIRLEIKKNNNAWIDREGNTISTDKVDEYFQELSTLKSSFIIDKYTDIQKKQINSLSHNAEYTVSIEDNKGNTIDYAISSIVKNINDLDLKNEEYFVVTISNNTTAYVVKKDFHDLFNKQSASLKVEAPSPNKN